MSPVRAGFPPGRDDRRGQSREQCHAGHEIGAYVPPAGLGRALGIGRVARHARAFARDEQTVRVQEDRRARDQRDQVAAGFDAHAPQIVRVDRPDARDLVGEGLGRDLNIEHVALPQFGQPGEQQGPKDRKYSAKALTLPLIASLRVLSKKS